MWAWYVPVNEFGQFLVAISVQHWFLTHHPHFLQPHWSHCLCCALLLPWPTSHQSLPGALSSVLRTHECSHCARAPWVCSEGRTMHQVPFLVHILGLSSRHREICRENDLWGVFLVFVYESFFFFFFHWCLCVYPRPKSLAESEWTRPGANLSDTLWPLLWLDWTTFECLTPTSLRMNSYQVNLPISSWLSGYLFPSYFDSWSFSCTEHSSWILW